MRKTNMPIILILLSILPAFSFFSAPVIKAGGGFAAPQFKEPAQVVPDISGKVLFFAQKFYQEKKRVIQIQDKSFPTDCSNFARAVYYAAFKIDFFMEAQNSGLLVGGLGYGVTAIYRLFEKKYQLKKTPAVGNLIFFDNTYDKNGNHKWDSILTHIAIVTEIAPDQTLTFIHGGTRQGIAKAYMNLQFPNLHKKDGIVINSYLQREYSWNKGKQKLTAELFRAFGEYTPEKP